MNYLIALLICVVSASALSLQKKSFTLCQDAGAFETISTSPVLSYVFDGSYGESGIVAGNCIGIANEVPLCQFKICPVSASDCLYLQGGDSKDSNEILSITGGSGRFIGAVGEMQVSYPGVKKNSPCKAEQYTHEIELR
jgi:hypothetical protein